MLMPILMRFSKLIVQQMLVNFRMLKHFGARKLIRLSISFVCLQIQGYNI